MKRDPEQCRKMILGGWGPKPYQCSRKWKVERDGKRYCTQHDPEKVAARHRSKRRRNLKLAIADAALEEAYWLSGEHTPKSIADACRAYREHLEKEPTDG